jgi:hypothetical protein
MDMDADTDTDMDTDKKFEIGCQYQNSVYFRIYLILDILGLKCSILDVGAYL